MKNRLLRFLCTIAIIATASVSANAQQPSRREIALPPGEPLDPYSEVLHCNTTDGGAVTVFKTRTTGFVYSIYMVKTFSNGSTEWAKRLSSYGAYSEVIQTADSGFTLCYTEYSHYFLLHMDAAGNTVYSKQIDLPAPFVIPQGALNLIAKPNGNCYVIGDVMDTLQAKYGYHVFEIDPAGNALWSHIYQLDFAYGMQIDAALCANGDLLVLTEHYDIPNSHHSPWVTRIAPGGAIVWSKYYEQPSFTLVGPRSIAVMPGDEIVVASVLGTLTLLLRCDGQGNVLWHFAYSRPSDFMVPEDIMAAENNTAVVWGYSSSTNVMMKVDSTGSVVSTRDYPNVTLHRGHQLTNQLYTITGVSSDALSIVFYITDIYGNACWDSSFTVAPTPLATVVTTLINSVPVPATQLTYTPTVTSAALSFNEVCNITGIEQSAQPEVSVYPVPASDQIRVESAVAMENAELVDVQGKTVYTEDLQSTHSSVLQLPPLADGIYLLRLSGSDGTVIQRKILVQQDR